MESSFETRLKEMSELLSSKYKLDLPAIYSFRKDLHKHPETAFKEVKTKEKLIAYLVNQGAKIEDIKHFAITGFTYDIVGTAPPQGSAMAIGIRADIDALPMKELNTFPHASIYPDVGHMCGHDGHAATLIGTAEVLLRIRSQIPSNKTVRLIFQPGEEGANGGGKMVAEGALDGLNDVYALHSGFYPFWQILCKGGRSNVFKSYWFRYRNNRKRLARGLSRKRK
eukprot:TRINITY_DN2202_c0_g1_i3.p3 TRINITY_DN2202_c0_g1~~TRINITY_DN2202_c0_g1_i3.p3  ORF type:complete len:225 (+),score=36.02 TRINITY_DN2202_c0_g1_i3:37-711(+)